MVTDGCGRFRYRFLELFYLNFDHLLKVIFGSLCILVKISIGYFITKNQSRKETQAKLRERVKEQECLYNVSLLNETSIKELLEQAVGYLPAGWQYPDITAASIQFGDQVFQSANYRDTDWKLTKDRTCLNGSELKISVVYLKATPTSGDPFINEEKRLINSIAEILVLKINQLLSLKQLQEKDRRLEKMAQMVHIGYWEIDLNNDVVHWSAMTKKIHEVADDYISDLETALSFYKAGEDRETITKVIHEAIYKGKPYDVELRIITAKGNERWIRSIGEPQMNKKGTCVRLEGSFQDVDEKKRMEIKSEQRRLLLETISKQTEVAMWVRDSEGRHLFVNKKWKKIFGLENQHVMGKTVFELLDEATASQFRNDDEKVLRENRSIKYEEWVSTPKGYRYYLTNMFPIPENSGVGGFATDITDLKETEQKLEGIFNSSFSFIGFLSPDGTLLEANETALQMAGITRDDVIGKKFWDCYWWQISEEAQKELQENIRKARNGEEVIYEVQVWIKDKNPITILFSLRPVFDANGLVKFIIPEGRPIQDIIEVRNRYKSVMKSTNVGTWEWNIQTGDTIFDERWAEIVGYRLKELEPVSINTWEELAHPDDLEESNRKLNECFDKKVEYYDIEVRMKHKDGHWIWVQDRGKVFEWTNDGKPLKMYGTHQDITERKSYEEALRVSEEAFRGNFENAAIGMALLDESGKWLKVNKRVCEIVGYSEEEMKKFTFQDITHPEDLDSDLELLNELIRGERDHYQMEKRYFNKDGQIVFIILAVSVVRDSENEILYFISQIIDISDKKETERKLHEAIDSLQAILDASTQVSIIATDAKGTITRFNKGAEKMLGYSVDEVVGKHTPQLFHLDEELDEKAEKLSEELGRKIQGFDVFIEEAKQGESTTNQWTYKRKDGSTYPILLSVTAIRRDDDIIGFLGVAADITSLEKIKEELRLLLNLSEKQNERLKNFAQIVTHNLRSHSSGISGMLEMLQLDYPEIYVNEYIEILEKASNNLKTTIVNLTDSVKKGFVEGEELKEINLKKAVERNISSAITTVNIEKIDIINEVEDDLNLQVIPAYLDSIIMNFLTNAVKYSSPDRESYVKIYTTKKQEYVQLSFEDNGVGIDLDKYKDKLFGMYNTFHDNEDSRGIGLYITKNQIESMGGYVEVESDINQGTTFKVNLLASRD